MLGSLNGFGFGMHGRRDFDRDTHTYIKNHTVTALFIPIFSLGSYRVADAPDGGWYFLGKEKMGSFAKGWNILLSTAVAGLIGLACYKNHVNSPEYLAKQELAAASEELSSTNYKDAMQGYLKAYRINSKSHKEAAIEGYRKAADAALTANDTGLQVFATRSLISTPFWRQIKSEYSSLYADTCKRAKSAASTSPEHALSLINQAKSLSKADTKWLETKFDILETIAATQNPVELIYAEELASMYEELGESAKIVNLLGPISASLKGNESARTLGSAYLEVGNYDAAVDLLNDYLSSRQSDWVIAQNEFESVYLQAQDRLIRKINSGQAPPHMYQRAEKLKGQEQIDEMWNEYLAKQVPLDPAVSRLQAILDRGANVPTAIMDLGIAYLRLAQVKPDKRAELLKQSEKTLLSMNSYAGGSTDYQLFLGQVYYWLGKSTEGKEQFDAIVAKHGTNFTVLMNLSYTLREIGVVEESQVLAEKAFKHSQNNQQKHEAASLLATMASTTDEKIEWLEKCNQKNPNTVIDIATVKAAKANEEDKPTEAARLYRKALDAYRKLPESPVNLNNSALVHFGLFYTTGETKHYEDGLKKIDKAIQLAPNDPITNSNAASFFFNAAAQSFFKDKLEAKAIQNGVSLSSTIRFFYTNETEREALCATIRQHPHYKKACKLFNKALLLAPQRRSLYNNGLETFGALRDEAQLKLVADKFDEADIDTTPDASWMEPFDQQNPAELRDAYSAAEKEYVERINELKTEKAKVLQSAEMLTADLNHFPVYKDKELSLRVARLKAFNQKFPSSAMSSALVKAQYALAIQQLANKQPKFAEWLEQSKGTVTQSDLVLLWLHSQPNAKATIDSCVGLKEALETDWSLWQRFPHSPSASNWVLASLLHPSKVSEVAAKITAKNFDTARADLANKLSEHYPAAKLTKTWLMMAKGDHKAAKAFYQDAKKSLKYLPDAY